MGTVLSASQLSLGTLAGQDLPVASGCDVPWRMVCF